MKDYRACAGYVVCLLDLVDCISECSVTYPLEEACCSKILCEAMFWFGVCFYYDRIFKKHFFFIHNAWSFVSKWQVGFGRRDTHDHRQCLINSIWTHLLLETHLIHSHVYRVNGIDWLHVKTTLRWIESMYIVWKGMWKWWEI